MRRENKPTSLRPRAGQVFVCRDKATRTPSRRVISTVRPPDVELEQTRVCYSTGGTTVRWCDLRAFRLWVKRYAAKPTRTRRPRTLVLRGGAVR